MPYPLDGFIQQLQEIPDKPKPELYSTDFSGMYRDAFKIAIPQIPQMDEAQLDTLIKSNLDVISADILNNDPAYASLLRDQKFISSFIRVMSGVRPDYNTKIACNKITYDYFTSKYPDPNIKTQYLKMSQVINYDAISKLKTIGLDENTASNLALCRYSSFSERTNVKRLNFAMYYRDPEIMTEQRIVWIYEKLFDRISDLFYATMFEVYSPEQEDEFGDNFMEIYATVGLAVLLILNNMTKNDIWKVLVGYHEEWECLNRPHTRFSLKSISTTDYSRVLETVEYLESQGIKIP